MADNDGTPTPPNVADTDPNSKPDTPEMDADPDSKPDTPETKEDPDSKPDTPEAKEDPDSKPDTPEMKEDPDSKPDTPEMAANPSSSTPETPASDDVDYGADSTTTNRSMFVTGMSGTVKENSKLLNNATNALFDRKVTSQLASSSSLTVSLGVILKTVLANSKLTMIMYVTNISLVSIGLVLQFVVGILAIVSHRSMSKVDSLLGNAKNSLKPTNSTTSPPSDGPDEDKTSESETQPKGNLDVWVNLLHPFEDVPKCTRPPEAIQKMRLKLSEKHKAAGKQLFHTHQALWKLETKYRVDTSSEQLSRDIAAARVEIEEISNYLRTLSVLMDLLLRKIYADRAERVQKIILAMMSVTLFINVLLCVLSH